MGAWTEHKWGSSLLLHRTSWTLKLTQTQIPPILAAWADPTYLAARIKGNSGFLFSEGNESRPVRSETERDRSDPAESETDGPVGRLATICAEGPLGLVS